MYQRSAALIVSLALCGSLLWGIAEEDSVISDTGFHAYYRELRGNNDTFTLKAREGQKLILQISIPVSEDPEKRFSALVIDRGRSKIAATLEPGTFPWEHVKEKYTGADIAQGPRLEIVLKEGVYDIIVGGSNEQGRYVLTIGDPNAGDILSIFRALVRAPIIMHSFFEELPLLATFFDAFMVLSALTLLIVAFRRRPTLDLSQDCGNLN